MNKQHMGLKLSFLGGVGEVGKNIMAVEFGNEILVIDSGMAFPTDDMPGIDVVLPDFTYLINNPNLTTGFLVLKKTPLISILSGISFPLFLPFWSVTSVCTVLLLTPKLPCCSSYCISCIYNIMC